MSRGRNRCLGVIPGGQDFLARAAAACGARLITHEMPPGGRTLATYSFQNADGSGLTIEQKKYLERCMVAKRIVPFTSTEEASAETRDTAPRRP